jgi:putative redox protein
MAEALPKIEAQLNWTGGRQYVGRADEGPAVVIDSREGGSGPSPMQLVLMGVAGCSAVDVVLILKKRRAKLKDLQINIRGTRAPEPPRRFTEIHIEYVVIGEGIKPKDVEMAIRLSETKYCSAIASVNAELTHSYRIVEQA